MTAGVILNFKKLSVEIAVSSDLWYMTASTSLPSKTYRMYMLIGANLKVYEELYLISFYLLAFKFVVAWSRK